MNTLAEVLLENLHCTFGSFLSLWWIILLSKFAFPTTFMLSAIGPTTLSIVSRKYQDNKFTKNHKTYRIYCTMSLWHYQFRNSQRYCFIYTCLKLFTNNSAREDLAGIRDSREWLILRSYRIQSSLNPCFRFSLTLQLPGPVERGWIRWLRFLLPTILCSLVWFCGLPAAGSPSPLVPYKL